MTPQQRIAILMETYELGQAEVGDPADGSPVRMNSDPPSSGAEVLDGRSHQRVTQMRECCATGCSYNTKGRLCSLDSITINDEGGCDDYVAAVDEDEKQDSDTISKIADMLPASPDHPSSLGNMYGKFNPGAML